MLEDDPFFSGLFARKFEIRGWKTTIVDDVKDIDKCVDNGMELLLIDIKSNDGAGLKLIQTFKKSQKTLHIPVVVLTEASDRETVQAIMGHGVDAYLLKGHVVPNEVVEKVHRILESRQV